MSSSSARTEVLGWAFTISAWRWVLGWKGKVVWSAGADAQHWLPYCGRAGDEDVSAQGMFLFIHSHNLFGQQRRLSGQRA